MAEITVREALRDAMAEEMRRDKNVFLMGEEVAQYQGAYKVSQGLLEEFGPKRVVDTTITEYGFAGIGVGAAFAGLRPIVEFMTFNFSLQAIDHIINSAAKTQYMSGGLVKCPIVFRGPNGAAARVAAQHSQDFSSTYSHIPGLTVISPFFASDAKALLKAAIRYDGPVVFLEHELVYGHKFEMSDTEVAIGKANIVKEGTDITVTSHSLRLGLALEAAQELEKLGISVEVIDLRTLKPLDTETIINSVRKTGRLVTVEEGWFFGGIGASISAIATRKAFDVLKAPPLNVTAKDIPLPYAANLEKLALPQIKDIIDACKQINEFK